ncbi:MAG: WD40 repeat domain-containing protein, partial [Ktedonobacteraceae bacterium]
FGVGGAWGWHNGRHSFVYRGHHTAVSGVAWSPDGKRIASCSQDGSAQVWDARDGDNASANYLLTTKWTPQEIPVTAVAWSPDSTRIAITSAAGDIFAWGDENTLFEGASWMVAEATPRSPAMNALAWSPDGGRIAAACADGSVQIWNGLNTNLFWPNAPASLVYRSHQASVTAVAWSPDGSHIVSGAKNGTLAIWNASTSVTAKEGHIEHGDSLVATKPLSLHTAAITTIASQPAAAGWIVLFADEEGWVTLWNANEEITTSTTILDGRAGRINALAWSPDGQRFVVGLQSGATEVWSLATAFAEEDSGPQSTQQRHHKPVTAVAWSPGGDGIASASLDSTVAVGYFHEGRELFWHQCRNNSKSAKISRTICIDEMGRTN